MNAMNFNSDNDVSMIIQKYYPDLPGELKKIVSGATPVEIGFSLTETTQIFVMFGEGFKGFLIVVHKGNRELRLAFARTFFGAKTNIPSIDFVEVLFENDMPVKRDFLNLILQDIDSDDFFTHLINTINEKSLDIFLKLLVENGKKTVSQELVQLDSFDYEFVTKLFREITDALKVSLEGKNKIKSTLIRYITSLDEKFPRLSKLFASYLASL